jgi:hypothetical protein
VPISTALPVKVRAPVVALMVIVLVLDVGFTIGPKSRSLVLVIFNDR